MTHTDHTNLLIDESSPYLLQHAHNSVDWWPWSETALARAREENKLILLSIGYSVCHWCHVMAHESFEDPATAQVMNELFVNIKVDREERPDLDKIYQSAHQLLNQRPGGWPLAMILTPQDRVPFLPAPISRWQHAMASGGIYDQLGGGFYRYSVDDYWMIPHCENRTTCTRHSRASILSAHSYS